MAPEAAATGPRSRGRTRHSSTTLAADPDIATAVTTMTGAVSHG
jgi:hypothetical protein